MVTKTVSYITKNKYGKIDKFEFEWEESTNTCDFGSYQFLTFDEIIKDIPNRLDELTLTNIKNMKKDDLITLHLTFGMWIRNTYGLWVPDNPTVDDQHPDDYSFMIIEQLWENLNNDSAFDKAMEIIDGS